MKKLLLSAAFLAIGTFAMAQQTDQMQSTQNMKMRDPAKMEQRRADNMKMMQSELNLSPSQVTQIKAMHDKKMEERKANSSQMTGDRKAKMEMMKRNQDQWNSDMKKILTPDQHTKWQSKKQEKMQDKMQHRKGNMMQKDMNTMPAKN